jgi:hypothetical protein
MPGCTVQVDPAATDIFFAVGTTAVWQRQIPNATALFGATIYCQGAALDPAANATGFVTSNHGAMLVGGK